MRVVVVIDFFLQRETENYWKKKLYRSGLCSYSHNLHPSESIIIMTESNVTYRSLQARIKHADQPMEDHGTYIYIESLSLHTHTHLKSLSLFQTRR